MGVRRLSAASESVLMKTRHTVLPPQHTSKDPLIETEASVYYVHSDLELEAMGVCIYI